MLNKIEVTIKVDNNLNMAEKETITTITNLITTRIIRITKETVIQDIILIQITKEATTL